MKKLLFVDDSKVLLFLYKSEFEADGYLVDTASNVAEAIGMLDRQSYDLVILEVQMPDMDGLESLRKFLCRHKRLPIIINSGLECYKDCSNFPVCPADSFVLKSSDMDELKKEVRNLMVETSIFL